MSKNFAVLGKIASERPLSVPPGRGHAAPHTEYGELTRRVFHAPTAVAVVGVDAAEPVSEICIRIAADLAASNRRVLVVSVEKILSMDPISVPDSHRFHTRIAQRLDMAISGRPETRNLPLTTIRRSEIGLIPCGGALISSSWTAHSSEWSLERRKWRRLRTKPSSSSMRAKQKNNKSEACSGRSNSPEPG